MAFSTTYDVKVRYSVDNRAGRAVGGLSNDTRALRSEVGKTSSAFMTLGTTVAAAFGARAAGKALVGFNSTVEDTKLQIAGMMAMAKKTDLVDQIKTADMLYGRLQKRAATLPGTTQEYVNMAGKITRVVTDAGGTVKQLEDLTVSAVVAAKGLGEHWEVAARDIEQGLMGRYNTTDPFLSKILPTIGYKGEEGRDKWRALSAEKRFTEMQKALGAKQIDQLGKAQGQTFSGVVSTLKDTLEQTLGKVGLPLFQAITAEVKGWNKWISENQGRVDEVAKSIGQGLVKGFEAVKSAVEFLVKHADLLISIGKVWLAVKVAGMVGGGLGGKALGAAGMVGGAMAWGRGPRDGFDAQGGYQHTPGGAGRQKLGARGVAENLGPIAMVGAAGYAVGTLINNATGMSNAISGAIEIEGKLLDVRDQTTQQYIVLTRGMQSLDASVAAAQKRLDGLASTGIAATLGDAEHKRRQAAAIKKHGSTEGHDTGSAVGNKFLDVFGSFMGIGDRKDIAQMGTRGKLSSMGLDADKVTKEQADALEAKAGKQEMNAGMSYVVGKTALGAGIAQLTDYQRQTLDVAQAQEQVMNEVFKAIASGVAFKPETIMTILKNLTADPKGTHKATVGKPNVNVTIQRIEVQSDDPDRMAFGMIEAFRDAAKNPSSAFSTLREG